MTTYDIYNTSTGHSLGYYDGETPEVALDAMARDAGYDGTDDMRLQTGVSCLEAHEVSACADCQTLGETRECYACGKIAVIIDCGHQPQPAPISAGRADGTDLDNWYCEDCAETGGPRVCYGCGVDLDPHAGLSVVYCGRCGDA